MFRPTALKAAALYALASLLLVATHLICDWIDTHPKKEPARG